MATETNVINTTFQFSTKQAKQVMALLELDIPSDQEIKERLSKTVVDLTSPKDEDSRNAAMAFALIAVGFAYDEEHTKK